MTRFLFLLFSLYYSVVFSQKLSIQYIVEKDEINQIFTMNINGETSIFFSNEYCSHQENENEDEEMEIYNSAFYVQKDNENTTFIYDRLENIDVYVEQKINQKWELLDETKMIGNVKLHKAKTIYKGKVWFAWYDNNVSLNAMPFIFSKLPGVVYELYTENFKISLLSIENKNQNCIQIPKKSKKIKKEVYDRYNKDFLKKISDVLGKNMDAFGTMVLQNVLQNAVKKDLFREFL